MTTSAAAASTRSEAAASSPEPDRRGRGRTVRTATLPDPATVAPQVEAVLLTSSRPISPSRLAQIILMPDEPATPAHSGDALPERVAVSKDQLDLIAAAVKQLNDSYQSSERSFRIEAVANGYRFMTLPAFAPLLARYHGVTSQSRLSRPAIETLAIVAYKQPITRARIEAIRGVACGDILRSLMERRLVSIAGRADELGRPILYGTSRQFLEAFGMASLKDLPGVSELDLRSAST
ncbi:MAG: SMC-Scp complex subunit ScpB [Phycisphaerae bacterium]|nr:SMC-Scp complex subunit ScpB [Phycisphaerae bacterium]